MGAKELLSIGTASPILLSPKGCFLAGCSFRKNLQSRNLLLGTRGLSERQEQLLSFFLTRGFQVIWRYFWKQSLRKEPLK
jgi:hypothetical protein